MIVPLLTLAALLAGAAVCWLAVGRMVPVPVVVPDARSVERAVWSRSARELYRTVIGVVDDVRVLALLSDQDGPSPEGNDGFADPAAARAWLVGAVTRARGSVTWAGSLRDQAVGREARRACDRVAVGMADLADVASTALAHPADRARARQVDVVRRQVQVDVEQLIRLL
jgi:hypothetical protein